MRKNFNKLATLALSGMMVMSMAVPAFATPQKANEWTKVLFTDTATPAPVTTFKFKVTAQPAQEITVGTTKFTTGSAAHDAVKFGEVTYRDGEYGDVIYQDNDPNKKAMGRQIKKTVEITVDTAKLHDGPGYYLFQMQEEHGGYEGIQYSRGIYDVLVYWEKDQKPVAFVQKQGVGNWIKEEGKANCKLDTIYNNYGMHEPPVNPDPNPNPDPHNPDPDPEPNDSTHDVFIKKVRKNNIGADQAEFKFNITVTPDKKKQKEFYGWRKGEKKENATDYTAFNGKVGLNGVKLTANSEEGIQIGGLTKGDKITVTETDGTSYTMTVKDNNDNQKTYIQQLSNETNLNQYYFAFNSLEDGGVVEVINTKNGATPTGIVMNVAPYAMMLAVAGGLGVVFVNRKKEEE